MAEIYSCGRDIRIFYRPQGFITGLILRVEVFWERDLEQLPEKIKLLQEFNTSGLYYFDYIFEKEGTYIGIFYEKREEKFVPITSQAFSTRRVPARAQATFLGNNVIGM